MFFSFSITTTEASASFAAVTIWFAILWYISSTLLLSLPLYFARRGFSFNLI
jgi:hypothetical protein